MEREEHYRKARKNVRKKKGFFFHLIAYVGVLLLLYLLGMTGPGRELMPMAIVAVSWGIAIGIHYFSVFQTEHLGFLGINPDWEEEELEKELDRLRRIRELKEDIRDEKVQVDELDRLELKEIERVYKERD